MAGAVVRVAATGGCRLTGGAQIGDEVVRTNAAKRVTAVRARTSGAEAAEKEDLVVASPRASARDGPGALEVLLRILPVVERKEEAEPIRGAASVIFFGSGMKPRTSG